MHERLHGPIAWWWTKLSCIVRFFTSSLHFLYVFNFHCTIPVVLGWTYKRCSHQRSFFAGQIGSIFLFCLHLFHRQTLRSLHTKHYCVLFVTKSIHLGSSGQLLWAITCLCFYHLIYLKIFQMKSSQGLKIIIIQNTVVNINALFTLKECNQKVDAEVIK